MNKFNVGDTVFDLRYGFGVVVDFPQNTIIFDKSEPPVKFEKDLIYYTKDGKYSYTDFAPSLLTLEEAAKLGYFPEKKKVKKQTDAWVILDPTIGCCIEILNQNPIPLNFFRDGSYHKNCIVVKTTLEWEVEE